MLVSRGAQGGADEATACSPPTASTSSLQPNHHTQDQASTSIGEYHTEWLGLVGLRHVGYACLACSSGVSLGFQQIAVDVGSAQMIACWELTGHNHEGQGRNLTLGTFHELHDVTVLLGAVWKRGELCACDVVENFCAPCCATCTDSHPGRMDDHRVQ